MVPHFCSRLVRAIIEHRNSIRPRSERVEVAEQRCCIGEDEPYFIDDLLIGIDVPIASNQVIGKSSVK
jgi:hypothetical protein